MSRSLRAPRLRRFGPSGASALAVLATLLAAPSSEASDPRAYIVSDLTRVRRGDLGARGATSLRLGALKGETVAFQVIVEAGETALSGVKVDVSSLTVGASSLRPAQRFLEHHVAVRSRSRNDKVAGESLGFTPSARPGDQSQLGDVPDALIPVELAKSFAHYPLEIPPTSTGAIWVDVDVSEAALPGAYSGRVTVSRPGAPDVSLFVTIDVLDVSLPFRPVSFFTYYDPAELRSRLGDDTRAEIQLWQLLHRHHIDVIAPIVTTADTTRLAKMLSGAAFQPAEGYEGPGEGIPPAVVALGSYGDLGDPEASKVANVEALAQAIPPGVEDVFLYAIDERCDSPRAGLWRKLLAPSSVSGRVRVGHTCSEDPTRQDVDIVLTTTDAFDERLAREARRKSRSVWVYNGQLPFSGPMVLDSPPSSLAVNGWIAATRDIGRWFFWETTFWNDDNKGGRGAIDPFVTAETFHNQSGDAALDDGLLLYPGTQRAPFEASSLGFDGVLPSIRLKMLRRGIEDAGYVALARSLDKTKTDAIARALVPRALGEVGPNEETPWSADTTAIEAAREGLRAMLQPGMKLSDTSAVSILREGAQARTIEPRPGQPKRSLWWAALALFLSAATALWLVVRRRSRHKPNQPNS